MHYKDAALLLVLCIYSNTCMAEDPTGLILTPSPGKLTNPTGDSVSFGLNFFNIDHPYLDDSATATTLLISNRAIGTDKHRSISHYAFHTGTINSPSLANASTAGFSYRTTSYLPYKFDWTHGYGIDYHTLRRSSFHPLTILTLNGNFGLQKRQHLSKNSNIALWSKTGVAYSVVDGSGGPDFSVNNDYTGSTTGRTKYAYISFGCSLEYENISLSASHHSAPNYSFTGMAASFDYPM